MKRLKQQYLYSKKINVVKLLRYTIYRKDISIFRWTVDENSPSFLGFYVQFYIAFLNIFHNTNNNNYYYYFYDDNLTKVGLLLRKCH